MKVRERWYLYSDDALLARDLLHADLAASSDPGERATLLHWLTLLGDCAGAAHHLATDPLLLREPAGRGALLRIRQEEGQANPWSALIPSEQVAAFKEHCDQLLQGAGVISVRLQGGLGDQLETVALMQASALAHRLEAVVPGTSARALVPLLESLNQRATMRWRGENQGPSAPWISATGLRWLLAEYALERPAQALGQGPTGLRNHQRLLVCWRSKCEPGEGLWAHLRSLPMAQIQWLTEHLLQQGFTLLDITAYTPWERDLLPSHPRHATHDPRRGSLADLADLMRTCQAVLSVDTALAHLALWHSWPTGLLLPQHPDPRWKGRQNECLHVWKQQHYNRWQPCLQELLCALPDWLPAEA